MDQKNKRFWHYWNGGVVKLTLSPGQRVRLYRCEETEEGYSGRSEEIFFEPHSGELQLSTEDFGADCDGPLNRESYEVASEMIFDAQVGGMVPNWDEKRHSVYDGFAQAMGY